VVELLSISSNRGTAGRLKVLAHSVVEGEDRSGRTDLGTHIADSRHTGTRERLDTWPVVFDDGASTALDGEDTGSFQDDVYYGSDKGRDDAVSGTDPSVWSIRSSFHPDRHR